MTNPPGNQPANSHPLESYGDPQRIARIFYWFIALIALGLAAGVVVVYTANTPGTKFTLAALGIGILPIIASALFVRRQQFEWAAVMLAWF
jgi:hypothetical protein